MTQTNFISAQNLISQTGWTNINAILLNNGTYAVSTPTTGLVSEFTVGNFLFNVPTGSLVSGLEFEFNAYRGITSLPSTTLELWAYDNTNSNNAWYQLTPVFTDLHLSASTFVLGGTTYTFNQNLTSDQVNNLKFKVIVNDEVYLGAFKVRVTYSEPVNSVTTSSSVCTTLLQAQPFKLLRPISATDTTCIVDKFKTSDGVDITTANLPVMGYPATIDPLTPKEENIKVLAVTVLSGDTRELTITRGWSFRDPDGQSPSLAKSHGLAELVLSNNFQYEQDKLRMCQIGSLVSEPITVFDEGGFIAKPVSAFDFVGSGVSVSQIADPLSLNGGKKAIVTINGTQPNTPNGNGGSTGTSGNTQVTNITYNTHSVSGTDRFTIISVSLESTATVTGITVGASLATFLGSSVQAGVRTEAWYVINTPLGINPVSVTTSSAVYLSSSQYTWNGVDQTLPIVLGSSSGANTNTSTGTGTTTVINSLLLHITGTHQPSITYTAGSGENILSQTLTGQMQTAIQQQIVGTPSTQTSNIALSQITNWANIIVSLSPVPVVGDKLVAVTSADTTPGYLASKIQAGANITLSVINPGANEKLQITSSGGGGGGLTDVQNVGGGDGEIFRDITGGDTINLKTLESSDGSITITDNADTIDLTVTSPSGGVASGLQYLPNTGLFYGFGLDQILMSVNPQDSTRSEYIFYTGGNTVPLNIYLATLNTAGQYQWSRILQLVTISSEQVSVAIDDNYIWVTKYVLGVSTTIYAYTRAGSLISTNSVAGLGVGGTLGGSVSTGNKLFMIVQTSSTNGVLFEFSLSGSTATSSANYSLTGLVAANFTTNIYKETDSNTNILFIGKSSTVVKDYSTNSTVPTTTFDTFYTNSKPGNAGQYVFYRPETSDYLNLAGWDTNWGGVDAKMYGDPLLGMPFEAGHLSL